MGGRRPGNSAVAIINGTNGNDTIRTAAAGGSLGGLANATDVADTITGLEGDDTIVAGAGNDTITGGVGADTLNGGANNDTLIATLAELAGDVIDGGDGTDALEISNTSVAIDLTGLSFSNIETLRIGGNNTLTASIEQLNALSSIVGFFNFGVASTITLANAGTVDLTGKLSSISTVTGTSGNDTITADVSTLNGLGGNHTFRNVSNASGFTTYSGGAGRDVYVLGTNAMTGTADSVSDFAVADDRIRITALLETFANYVVGSDPFASGHARFLVSGNSAALQLDSDGSAGPAAFRTVLNLTNLANPAAVTSAVVFNQAPNTGNDSFSVAEDNVLTVAAPGVLVNDSDPNFDPLEALLVSGPTNGSLTLNADGSFTYTPNENFFGSDSFTYRPTDGELQGAVGTVSITVTPVNDVPSDIALGNASVAENSAPGTVVGTLAAIDIDDAASALTFSVIAAGPFGVSGTNLVVTGPLAFEATPSLDVTIRVTDEAGLFRDEVFTVSILDVNEAPVAVGESYVATEDTALVVPVASGLLANDTDVDSTALSALVQTGPANGTLVLNPNGSFTYTPNVNFSGPDSFTYRVSDGSLQGFTTTVQIGVLPVNDLPNAVNDSFAGTEDAAITGNVTGNDIDVDGPILTVALVAGPANGTVVLDTLSGNFTYTPNANFNGTDSCTYTLSDGLATSAPATVTLTLAAADDAPVAVADTFAGTQDTTLSIPLANLLANDTHADGAAALAGTTVTAVSAPAAGIASVSIVGGQVQVVPVAGFSGGTGFTYTITDADGDTANGAVTVNFGVSLNFPPVAGADAFSGAEDDSLTGNVLANDFDAQPVSAALETGPASAASFTLNPDGSFTYVPLANFNGTDSFTYRAFDGALSSTPATVTLTITPANDLPTADNGTLTVAEDSPATAVDLLSLLTPPMSKGRSAWSRSSPRRSAPRSSTPTAASSSPPRPTPTAPIRWTW